MQYVFSDKIANLRPSAIREILKAPSDANTIDFAAGNPSPESFPVRDLARLAADLFAQESTTALQYGVTEGYEPLRRAVAERQRKVFGIGRSGTAGDTFRDRNCHCFGRSAGNRACLQGFLQRRRYGYLRGAYLCGRAQCLPLLRGAPGRRPAPG